MSFTLHFIDKGWKLDSLVHAAHFLPEDHTADILVDALQETMSEWSLKAENLVYLTTDSGSNIFSAARKLGYLLFAITWIWPLRKLFLRIRDVTALAVARRIVSSFSCSWNRRELTKAQANLNIPQHSLISVSHIIILRVHTVY